MSKVVNQKTRKVINFFEQTWISFTNLKGWWVLILVEIYEKDENVKYLQTCKLIDDEKQAIVNLTWSFSSEKLEIT